jgi:hypothetical protein
MYILTVAPELPVPLSLTTIREPSANSSLMPCSKMMSQLYIHGAEKQKKNRNAAHT